MTELADRLAAAVDDDVRAVLVREAAAAGPVDLAALKLRGLQLDGADLSKATLTGGVFSQASFAGAVLEGADGSKGDFSHGNFKGARMGEMRLQDALLEEATLTEATLRFADLRGAFGELAVLDRADLWGARLERADFSGASMRGAQIGEATAAGCDFSRADLREALLTSIDWCSAKLADADLRGARLNGATLTGADLTGAWLQDVDLSSCAVDGVCWARARLNRTQLSQAQVAGGIGEERAGDYAQAADGYGALQRNFISLGDGEAASWAYRAKRRMEKRASRAAAAAAWHARRPGAWLAAAARYAGEQMIESTSGYGESVGRVLVSLMVVYVVFVLIYGVTGSVVRLDGAVQTVSHRPLDLAIFALMAMTTSGTPSAFLAPSGVLALLLAGTQALISIFLTGLLGFVAGNRIRR